MPTGMITPVYDTEADRIKEQLATAAALRKQGMSGDIGEGYQGGKVYIVGNPLGNIAASIGGAFLDRRAREAQGAMEQRQNQERQDFLAAMPSATETQHYDPVANPGTGPLVEGMEVPRDARALAQATQQWAARAPRGMEGVQQFALQQALTAPQRQADMEFRAKEVATLAAERQAAELQRQRERLEEQARRERERAQDRADNIRLAASLRPGTSDIDMQIKQAKLDALKTPPPAKLTPTDMKELYETDEMVQASKNSVDLLNQAKEYSKDAYSGYFALPRAQAKSVLGGSKEADATIQLNNILTGQGLEALKATFGAAPTEGERKILLDMQASADKTPKQRADIIDRAIAAANKRIQFNSEKAKAIRGRTYAAPEGAPGGAPTPTTPVDFGSLK